VLGITAETQNGASKITSEIDDENQIKNSLYPHKDISPSGRVREITAEERFEPRILESFDPVTQELYRKEFLQ
jgi:hypothetical protein